MAWKSRVLGASNVEILGEGSTLQLQPQVRHFGTDGQFIIIEDVTGSAWQDTNAIFTSFFLSATI